MSVDNNSSIVSQLLMQTMLNIKNDIKQNMENLQRNASNQSVKSLSVIVESDKVAYLEGLNTFFFMERGRKKGKIPHKFTDIIRQWIIDKGISVTPKDSKSGRGKYSSQERGIREMAGAIAYTIKHNGTLLHRTGRFDDIMTTSIEKETEHLGDRMLEFLESKFDIMITK